MRRLSEGAFSYKPKEEGEPERLASRHAPLACLCGYVGKEGNGKENQMSLYVYVHV